MHFSYQVVKLEFLFDQKPNFTIENGHHVSENDGRKTNTWLHACNDCHEEEDIYTICSTKQICCSKYRLPEKRSGTRSIRLNQGPPERKKNEKGKGLEDSRSTHTKNASRGMAARDERQLNLELLGQSRRRKKISFRDSFDPDGYNYFVCFGYRGFSPLAFQGLLA